MTTKKSTVRMAGVAVVLLLALASACALFFGPSAEELKEIEQAVQQGGTLVIDVRSPEEYSTSHLTSAVNIPVGELKDRLAELGAKDRPLVVY